MWIVLSPSGLEASKVLCGFVLSFQEILSQVILPVGCIPVFRKLALLPVAVANVSLD